MGFFTNYNRRRLQLTGGESVATLELMQAYFAEGANWTRDMYQNATGARCLVGAANHVRVSSIDDTKHWLRAAIAEVEPGIKRIEDFNDTRRTFDEVAAVIERARQLATQSNVRALPPPAPAPWAPPPTPVPAPVVEILPPSPAPTMFLQSRRRAPERRRSLASWAME